MYNYPPKADDSLVKKESKDKKSDNEGQKIKKQYEDMMEGQKKVFEAEIKNLRNEMSDEIETLTEMFSSASRDLLNLTFDHRALQKQMTEYSEKSEKYTKELE